MVLQLLLIGLFDCVVFVVGLLLLFIMCLVLLILELMVGLCGLLVFGCLLVVLGFDWFEFLFVVVYGVIYCVVVFDLVLVLMTWWWGLLVRLYGLVLIWCY